MGNREKISTTIERIWDIFTGLLLITILVSLVSTIFFGVGSNILWGSVVLIFINCMLRALFYDQTEFWKEIGIAIKGIWQILSGVLALIVVVSFFTTIFFGFGGEVFAYSFLIFFLNYYLYHLTYLDDNNFI